MSTADLSIKVEADLGGTLSKIDQLKAKLNQTKENVELIKAELKGMGQSLTANDKAIAATNKQLKGMTIGSKEAAKEAAGLKAQLASLAQTNNVLVQGISKTKLELAAETDALKIHTKEVKAAETGGSGFSKGLSSIWGGLRKIAYIVPGLGIAGLIGLLTGPLIAGFDLLIEKIRNTNKALLDLTEFNKKAAEDYGKEASSLLILRNAIENVNLPMATRLQAIKDLKKEFPGLFNGLTNEQLLTGNVAAAYDLATKAIIRKARASAAAAELEKIAAQKFKILQKSEEDAALTNEKLSKAAPKLVTFGTQLEKLSKKQVQQGILDFYNARKKGDQEQIDQLNKQQAFLLKIAMDGADQTIEIEEEKVKKIKKVHEKLVKEVKRRDYLPAFIHIKTSDEILAELNKVQQDIYNALGKKPMIAKIQLQANINNSDADTAFLMKLRETAKRVDEITQSMADSLKNTMNDAFASIGEGIANSLGSGADIGKSIFGSLFKILGAGIEQLGKSMIALGTAKMVIEKFKFSPGIGTVLAGIATVAAGALLQKAIPGFANGIENFRGGLAMVGERGPELVRLPKGSDVIPNGRMNGMSAGGTQVFIPAITLRGQDLVLAFNRANQTISRNG